VEEEEREGDGESGWAGDLRPMETLLVRYYQTLTN